MFHQATANPDYLADQGLSKREKEVMLLVAGGQADPNVVCVSKRLTSRGEQAKALLVGKDSAPRVTWDVTQDRLWIEGEPVAPSAVFLRYDVFSYLEGGSQEKQRRAGKWYHTLLSWALAHEKVAFLNRKYGASQASKPRNLLLARAAGLPIPRTLISNDLAVLDDLSADRWIAKPVTGGEHTELIDNLRHENARRQNYLAAPTIIQQRLETPDLRIYRVGDKWFPFVLESDEVDYRASRNVKVQPAAAPLGMVRALAVLMNSLGLNFGAADFKQCSETGRHLFLEVNSAPMFSSFDQILSGEMTDAIIDWLVDNCAPGVEIAS